MDIREFLKSKFGSKKQVLVKSENGKLITPEQKTEQQQQKAEAEKCAAEEQEKKVKQDIREALAFVNFESTVCEETNKQKKSTISKSTEPQKKVIPQSKTTSQKIDIDTNIDVPLMEEHPRTTESDELDKYAKEAADLLEYSFHTKTNSTKHKPNIQHIKSSQGTPKTKAQGFDIDM